MEQLPFFIFYMAHHIGKACKTFLKYAGGFDIQFLLHALYDGGPVHCAPMSYLNKKRCVH